MEKELGFTRSDIIGKLEENGYLVLPKGTKVDLTLLFDRPQSNTINLADTKSFFESSSERIKKFSDVMLEDDILVNNIVGFYWAEEEDTYEFLLTNANLLELERRIKKFSDVMLEDDILVNNIVGFYWAEEEDTYEFLLTNANLLELERERFEFERSVLEMFDFSDYQEEEYPQDLGDIDMPIFNHDNPQEGKVIREMMRSFGNRISPVYKDLNKSFLQSLPVDFGDTEDLDYLTVTIKV